jgi:Protein of unknown function (DUF3489)
MSEKVTRFPIQRYSFRAGGKTYFFIIPPFAPRKPKPAEVIPISTTLSDAGEVAGEVASLNLPSALPGVMNVLTTNSGRRSNMKTFIINSENKVTAGSESLPSAAGVVQFTTINELTEVTREWPMVRFVAVWNGLPGGTALQRFTDRHTAVARIWKKLQNAAEPIKVSRPGGGRIRSKKTVAREGSKKARILVLLKRPKGATIDDIIHATGWQAHTVRGFISGNLINRMGLKVNSTRRFGGARTYQIMRG